MGQAFGGTHALECQDYLIRPCGNHTVLTFKCIRPERLPSPTTAYHSNSPLVPNFQWQQHHSNLALAAWRDHLSSCPNQVMSKVASRLSKFSFSCLPP